ncbi:hypothetical protein N9Y67_01035 [Pseudomonadota bacterium]|nr:hypothetical protein [Pseudomonadota bacterium]
MRVFNKLILSVISFSVISSVLADGVAIDKVYHPYVQPLEREIELRMISAGDGQKYRLGLGTALSDRLFIEGYVIGTNVNNDQLDVSAYELEVKYQLTEQGEYAMDWGVIAELEKERHEDNWEAATGLILEKEWASWSGTANLWAIYEWGDTIQNELESSLSLQARYRYSRYFEPAVEFYRGQNTSGLGPAVMGDVWFSGRNKLHWEAGVIFGLDSETDANTWRLLTEFEF